MKRVNKNIQTIDEYIKLSPKEQQNILKNIREVIKSAAPDAEEKISYQMPTFYLKGNLVHFALHKNHIGLYPTPSGITNFKKELSKYATSKGAIQFPLSQPIPYNLINRIVKFRVAENLKNTNSKRIMKKALTNA